MNSIPHWSNESVLGVRQSKSGVVLLTNPLDGLISTGMPCWPTPEITQKLYKFDRLGGYTPEQLEPLTRVLGHFCALQSLHSEDAMTWGVFGPLVYASAETRERWTRGLLDALGLANASEKGATISLWRRLPHPETWGVGGPEIDVMLLTQDSMILLEAKWLSNEGTGQGKGKNRGQMELRRDLLTDRGLRALFPNCRHFALVGLSIYGGLTNASNDDMPMVERDLTWEDLCSVAGHPCPKELKAHYQWRLEHSRLPKRGRIPNMLDGPGAFLQF